MKIKPQQHKCKVPKCPYRHDQPQQQESKSRRFGKSTLVTNAFLVAAKTGQKAIFENPDYVCLTRESYKAFISTERQRVLGKERKHLIQAIDELIDHETTSESEYQKDAGKNYDPNSYGRGFHAGFVASLKLVKESLEEDEV